MALRYEETLHRDNGRCGVYVKATRKGIEVGGWYDTFVGIGDSVTVPWSLIDEARRKLSEVKPRVGTDRRNATRIQLRR